MGVCSDTDGNIWRGFEVKGSGVGSIEALNDAINQYCAEETIKEYKNSLTVIRELPTYLFVARTFPEWVISNSSSGAVIMLRWKAGFSTFELHHGLTGTDMFFYDRTQTDTNFGGGHRIVRNPSNKDIAEIAELVI